MSTKKTTTTTNAYDPTAMGAYDSQVSAGSSALLGEINNPTGNMFFQQQQQMGNLQNSASAQSQNQVTQQNLSQQGISPGSPLYQQMMNQNQRSQMATQAQSNNNLLLNAGNLRQSAINSAMSFNPLQTGGTQTQTSSGLGTWLPQVAGAAIGAGTAIATGGAGAMSNLGAGGLSASTAQNQMAPISNGSYSGSPLAPIAPNVGYQSPSQSYWGGLLGQS